MSHPSLPPSLLFRREREATWRELEVLVGKVEQRNLRSLDARELARLPLLYRTTLSSLAVARTMCLSRNQLEYLENLCARAYTCLNAPPPRVRAALSRFFGERFPALVRHRFALHVALSALIFLLGSVTGFVLTAHNPEHFYAFVDEAYAQGRSPQASTEELREVLYDDGGNTDRLSAFASYLLSNNARIGMMCFALGFAFGIPVIYLLFSNGLVLGAFGALYHSRGLGWDFFGWVLPHGVPEIFAVILCGGAGLAIAHALIFPRRLTRLESLRRTGRDAGAVVLGAVFLFFVAAVIEGFFRQLVADITVRYAMVVLVSLVLATWLMLAGRARTAVEAP